MKTRILRGGWFLAQTDDGEVIVTAPGCDPGGMTIKKGDSGTLALRILRALCLSLLKDAP